MVRRSTARDPHPMFTDAVSVSRFWSLVDTSGDCWKWQGDTDRNGYGIFQFRGKRFGAHELALSFTTGEKRAEGFDTCHSCDNPACCRPAHLRFDSRLSNVREMHERGRAARSGRLTDEQVYEIRIRRESGARQKDLARDYGITDGQVSMIVRGLRWPDAPGPIATNHHRRGA